jgi:hypothetical protein
MSEQWSVTFPIYNERTRATGIHQFVVDADDHDKALAEAVDQAQSPAAIRHRGGADLLVERARVTHFQRH